MPKKSERPSRKKHKDQEEAGEAAGAAGSSTSLQNVLANPDKAPPKSYTDIPPLLAELAKEIGVYTQYTDQTGNEIYIQADTVRAMLSALGHKVDTDDAIERTLDAVRMRDWRRKVPPVLVSRQTQEACLWVHVPHGDTVDVYVELEGEGVSNPIYLEQFGAEEGDPHEVTARNVDGVLIKELSYRVPEGLPLGWHTIIVNHKGERATTTLVMAPHRLHPERVIGDRLWGFMAQVYATRSHRSWGLGDINDCKMLAEWSAREWGAGFVLINPLHAAAPVSPIANSPYSPITRRFSNPIYIHIEDIPELGKLDEDDRLTIYDTEHRMQMRNKTPDLLDRDAVWEAKLQALELIYKVELSSERAAEFQEYCDREGAGLRDYATWCAISEAHGPLISQWPPELQHPHNPGVEAFRAAQKDRVRFHSWVQWLLEEQLETLQHTAREAGMPVGIVHDLAVSVHAQGADAWALEDVFIRNVGLGSPPDSFNQLGQNWCIPPWHPQALRDAAYIPFRDMLRTILRAAGGIRIDHAYGLFRLWCVPDGFGASKGTYITMDHDAMIGVLCLEAHRAGAIVIAEDVGTGLPIVPEVLRDRGILGTNIMLCEHDIRPADWRRETLLSVTVHDLPPTAGFLRNEHVRIRHELGLLVRPVEDEQRDEDARRERWAASLKEQGLLAEDADIRTDDGLDAMALALYRAAGASDARLVGVYLTDVLGDRRTQNQPGTDREYPNWRVPMGDAQGHPLVLEDYMGGHARQAVRSFVESVQLRGHRELSSGGGGSGGAAGGGASEGVEKGLERVRLVDEKQAGQHKAQHGSSNVAETAPAAVSTRGDGGVGAV